MAKNHCSVCRSANASAVNRHLAAGKSVRSAAQMFGLSRSTLGRHAAHAAAGRSAAATPIGVVDIQGRNRIAADATIAALRAAGRLESIDSARVATFQTLADAVDADPVNASLWREYRAAESTLREVNDDGNDELTEILGRLSTPTGDAEDKE